MALYESMWNAHTKRLVAGVFGVLLFFGLSAWGVARISNEPVPRPATSVAPFDSTSSDVLVPTSEEMSAQAAKDIVILIEKDNLARANKSLDQFKAKFSDCVWAQEQGLGLSPRAAGTSMDYVVSVLTNVAPKNPPIFGFATLTTEVGTYWVVLGASCDA